jgi:hypothetical protein
MSGTNPRPNGHGAAGRGLDTEGRHKARRLFAGGPLADGALRDTQPFGECGLRQGGSPEICCNG